MGSESGAKLQRFSLVSKRASFDLRGTGRRGRRYGGLDKLSCISLYVCKQVIEPSSGRSTLIMWNKSLVERLVEKNFHSITRGVIYLSLSHL